MRTIPMLGSPRRARLGAEELIELGQSSAPGLPFVAPAATSVSAAGAARTVAVSASEVKLLLTVVDNIVAFSTDYPVEYHSYCPTERWESALVKVGTWSASAAEQLGRGATSIQIPADVVLYLIDLSRCVDSSKDARLSSTRWAFTISSVAGIASWITGMAWLGIPAYLTGLVLLYGRPLYAKYQAVPEEPYKASIAGRRVTSGYRTILGSRDTMAGCVAPDETEEEARKVKYLERVILPEGGGTFNHYWGTVESPGNINGESALCLEKGRFRIHVEGFLGDRVMPANGWSRAVVCEPSALNTVAVWEVPGEPRLTEFGPVPTESRHEEDYWVEYVGPLTRGAMRRAGPFGCPFDTRDHALEDSGLTVRGRDGDFVVFDSEGNIVEVSMTG